MPGLALASADRAVSMYERVLAVGQAYGAAAVQAVYTQKATALERFRGVATRVLRSLHALPVPRVSRPAFTAQVA